MLFKVSTTVEADIEFVLDVPSKAAITDEVVAQHVDKALADDCDWHFPDNDNDHIVTEEIVDLLDARTWHIGT